MPIMKLVALVILDHACSLSALAMFFIVVSPGKNDLIQSQPVTALA